MSNSFRFLNEHKQKWWLNVGDTVKKCPKSWEWPCLVTLSGPRATGFMKLHPHGLKNRFPVKFPIPKMPSMFFQQYTICYTMLYYITVILIHYIYLYINIFYIYVYIIRVFIYILQHLFIRVFAETLPQLRWPGSVAGEFPTVNISVQRWEAKSPTQINPGGPNHCTQMVQLVKRLSENPVFRSTSSGFLSPLNPC